MKWLLLTRASNAPTAATNILAGYLLANHHWGGAEGNWPALLCLIASSLCLYSSGMVLNDVFDAAEDKITQPNRPIPGGQISLSAATFAGWGLLGMGVVAALIAGVLTSPESVMRCGLVATCLALTIYLYDGPLKKTPLAPMLMGSCRSLNFLLGATTVSGTTLATQNRLAVAGIPVEVWWAAIAMGVLITGVTLLARNERATVQQRSKIAVAGGVMATGFVLLATLVWCPGARFPAAAVQTYPLLVAIVALPSFRRVLVCLADLQPRSVKLAIISTLRSLIVFDASICFLVRPDNAAYALAVAALILPVLLLSKWIYQT